MNWIAKQTIGCLLLCPAAVAWCAEPTAPFETPCPDYSTFEIVINTGEFADKCFEAEYMHLPDPADKVMTENDIDLDNVREILERRPAEGLMFTYYVFEASQVGNLYKGYFMAPQAFRVRRTSDQKVVLEYQLRTEQGRRTTHRLAYQDGSWVTLP